MNCLNEFDASSSDLYNRSSIQQSEIQELTRSIHQQSQQLQRLKMEGILIQQLQRMSIYLYWDLPQYLDNFDVFQLRGVNKFFRNIHQQLANNIKLKLSNEILNLKDATIIDHQENTYIVGDTDKNGSTILEGLKKSLMWQLMDLENPSQSTLSIIMVFGSLMEESKKGPNDWNTLFKYLNNDKWSKRAFFEQKKQLNQEQIKQLNRIQYIKIDELPSTIRILYRYLENVLKANDKPARKKIRQNNKYLYLLQHD